MTQKPNWRTSSYTQTDTCVEVADDDPVEVYVRDSKNRSGAMLVFPRESWAEFIEFSKTSPV